MTPRPLVIERPTPTLVIERRSAVIALDRREPKPFTVERPAKRELVIERFGMRGADGTQGEPGEGAENYDPGDITLIFENQLI